MAIEWLEHTSHQLTPAICRCVDTLYQHLEWQLRLNAGTMVIGLRNCFTTKLAQIKTIADDMACRVVNMTSGKWVHFQVCLSHAQTEAITWRLAEMECITVQLDRMLGVLSNRGNGTCVIVRKIDATEFPRMEYITPIPDSKSMPVPWCLVGFHGNLVIIW